VTADTRRHTVLVVDDDADVLRTLEYALGQRFRLVTAASGAEALDLLAATQVSVLLTDERMPGMSGVELCARARELRPGLTCMILTAYADLQAATDAINRGQVRRFLRKPWEQSTLEREIEGALAQVTADREAQQLGQQLMQAAPAQVAAIIQGQLRHELRKILQSLRIQQERALRRVERTLGTGVSSPELTEARDAQRAALDALDLVKKVLSRYGRSAESMSLELPECDVTTVVDTTVRLLHHTVDTVAQLHVRHAAPVRARVPGSLLAQIVVNLVTNAAQAIETTSRHGLISVEVDAAEHDAVLRVRDDGPGMPKEDLEHIFEAGYPTRTEGRGFGLAIVHDLATGAGGTVTVESVPGVGTTFEVRLPRLRV